MKVDRRTDYLNALLVDAAIAVRLPYGDMAAIRVLWGRGLDHSVILRVISEKAPRRTAAFRPLHG